MKRAAAARCGCAACLLVGGRVRDDLQEGVEHEPLQLRQLEEDHLREGILPRDGVLV